MRQASVLNLDDGSPSWAADSKSPKVSHQPNTEFHTWRGNEPSEAERREALNHSAIEPIEAREPEPDGVGEDGEMLQGDSMNSGEPMHSHGYGQMTRSAKYYNRICFPPLARS